MSVKLYPVKRKIYLALLCVISSGIAACFPLSNGQQPIATQDTENLEVIPTSSPTTHAKEVSDGSSLQPRETPTLSLAEESAVLASLMASPADCTLPCWWGLVPHQSAIDDVTQLIQERRLAHWAAGQTAPHVYEVAVSLSYFNPQASFFSADVRAVFQAHRGDDSLDLIWITAERPKSPAERAQYLAQWQRYDLETILDNFGLPDYAAIKRVNPNYPPPVFAIDLVYQAQGMQFEYEVAGRFTDEREDVAEICLSFEQVASVEVKLYAPEDATALRDEVYLLVNTLESYDQYYAWDINTGQSLSTLYNTHKENLGEQCVRVPSYQGPT